MNSVAIVHGGAVGVYEESARALELVRSVGADPVMIAVNEAGITMPVLHHWGSLHPGKFGLWIAQRKALGYPTDYRTWSIFATHHVQNIVRNWGGGSSGLHGADIAIHGLGIPAVIVCGVRLDDGVNQFRGKPWVEFKACRATWEHPDVLPITQKRVRSMAGPHPVTGEAAWTTDLLGEPDAEWLEELVS